MFLTPAELEALTDFRLPSAQKRWLVKHGWEFEVSGMGRPKVLRAYAEQRMGLAVAKPKGQTEPDFSAWGGIAA